MKEFSLTLPCNKCVLLNLFQRFLCNKADLSGFLNVFLQITHQRTEARPRQRHREGGHRNGAKVKDFRIDVERRESLNATKESFISINTTAVPPSAKRIGRRATMLLTYPWGDDNWLESLKNWFDGNRWVHTAERIRGDANVKRDYCKVAFESKGRADKSTAPEVQHRVGNSWSSVFKRLNDDCKTLAQRQ